MAAPVLGVVLRRALGVGLRMAARALAARTSEQMRDAHPAAAWVVGGAVFIGAVPAVTALMAGLMLQVVVFGSLAAGAASIDRGATGWVRRAEIEPAMASVEAPGVWSWPVAGRITTPYGGCTVAMCPHWGIDIAAPAGTPVRAAADGVVAVIGWDPDGYGRYIVLAHGGDWRTLYAHLLLAAATRGDLTVGRAVGRGDPIGDVGSTGASTGPHLHFEVRRGGVFVDPTAALRGT